MSQLASADTPRLGERTATHIDQPLKQDLSQLQTTNPTPFDLCRRTAREDCLITSREKLQFFPSRKNNSLPGVAARGLEPRPTGRWQALQETPQRRQRWRQPFLACPPDPKKGRPVTREAQFRFARDSPLGGGGSNHRSPIIKQF